MTRKKKTFPFFFESISVSREFPSMKKEKDLYKVLQVPKHASEEDIKKQFKKMAMQHHPDRGGDAERFKELNEAYAVLSDAEKRRHYDMFGSTSGMMPSADVGDLFENLFGGMMFPFGGAGGHSSGRSSSGKKKVTPKQLELWVSLEEVYQGAKIPFNVKRKVYHGNPASASSICMECRGSGNSIQQIQMGFMVTQTISPCIRCSGTGYRWEPSDFKEVDTVLSIPLPKGIPEGQQVLVRDKGDEMPGMEVGDLVFLVRYKSHDIYKTTDALCDLSCSLSLTFAEYLNGFHRSIPYLDGTSLNLYHPARPLSLHIEGSTLVKRLKDYGLRYQNHYGDLILSISIQLPEDIQYRLADIVSTTPSTTTSSSSSESSSFHRIDLSILP